MSNVEGRNSIDLYGFKSQSAAIQSFEILRFCGSLFNPAVSLIEKDISVLRSLIQAPPLG
jgi:hypothetical protein